MLVSSHQTGPKAPRRRPSLYAPGHKLGRCNASSLIAKWSVLAGGCWRLGHEANIKWNVGQAMLAGLDERKMIIAFIAWVGF